MKYPIEQLLTNEKIICHEVRASTYETNHVLLHFFITEEKNNEYSYPVFKMGYERYKATADEIEKNSSSPSQERIRHVSFISTNDHPNVLFTHPDAVNGDYQLKNDWTGEQPEIINHPSSFDTSHLSGTSPQNIATNKNLRYVEEMVDNSIYATDDVLTEKTYLASKDSAFIHAPLDDSNKHSDAIKEMKENEQKSSHSIWTSEIHFDKFEQCTNEELLDLLRKYKPYIGVHIRPNLDTESSLSIDMVSVFGVSFDVLRLRTNLFNKDKDDHLEGQGVLVSES